MNNLLRLILLFVLSCAPFTTLHALANVRYDRLMRSNLPHAWKGSVSSAWIVLESGNVVHFADLWEKENACPLLLKPLTPLELQPIGSLGDEFHALDALVVRDISRVQSQRLVIVWVPNQKEFFALAALYRPTRKPIPAASAGGASRPPPPPNVPVGSSPSPSASNGQSLCDCEGEICVSSDGTASFELSCGVVKVKVASSGFQIGLKSDKAEGAVAFP